MVSLLTSTLIGQQLPDWYTATPTFPIPDYEGWCKTSNWVNLDMGVANGDTVPSLSDIVQQDSLCVYVKRGTQDTINTAFTIHGYSYNYWGAYGEGEDPLFYCNTNDEKVFNFYDYFKLVVEGWHVIGRNWPRAAFSTSYFSVPAEWMYLLNCRADSVDWGFRTDGLYEYGKKVIIDSFRCNESGDDNIYIQNNDSCQISNSILTQPSERTISGDNIQFGLEQDFMHIYGNYMSKEVSGVKQCLIVDFQDNDTLAHSIVEGNLFIGPDSISGEFNCAVYYDGGTIGGPMQIFKYNTISGTNAALFIRKQSKVNAYYNIFDLHLKQGGTFISNYGDSSYFSNNLFRKKGLPNGSRGYSDTDSISFFRNNNYVNLYDPIPTSVTNADHDYNNFWECTNIPTETNGLNVDPLFIDTLEYKLNPLSELVNAGVNVGLTRDFYNNVVTGFPDIGIYEYVQTYQYDTVVIDSFVVNITQSIYLPINTINITNLSNTYNYGDIEITTSSGGISSNGQIPISEWNDSTSRTYGFGSSVNLNMYIDNLSSNYLYDIVAQANRSGDGTRENPIAVHGDTVVVNVYNEANPIAEFNNVVPINDSITIQSIPGVSTFSYINGVKVYIKELKPIIPYQPHSRVTVVGGSAFINNGCLITGRRR